MRAAWDVLTWIFCGIDLEVAAAGLLAVIGIVIDSEEKGCKILVRARKLSKLLVEDLLCLRVCWRGMAHGIRHDSATTPTE